MTRRHWVGILILAVGACSPVLEPEDVRGEFVLQSTPVALQTPQESHTILADTLRIASNGTATRVVADSIRTEAGLFVRTRIEEYRWRIRGGAIEFSIVCPPNALMLCTPPPHIWGTSTSTGLQLHLSYDPGTRLNYARSRNTPVE